MDEICRALFGVLWAWPAMWWTQKIGFRSLPAAVLVAVWFIPGWWIYRVIGG